MALDGYTINGSCLVYVGTGSAGALELLGYTDNGVDMQVNTNRSEIFTDIYGPMTPHDFQDMGMTARVVVPFVVLDRTVLTKLLTRGDNSGSGSTQGLLNQPGRVVGVSGDAVKVALSSPADVGWIFPTCLVRPMFGTRLATKINPFRIEFLAWPYQSYTATTGKNAVLWQRGSVPS